MKSIFKVAAITIMNGGDNIGTYIPLFSQAKKAEVAVYVVVYYIMLGIWCLVAYLIIGQQHFLRLVQKYVHWILPLLYIGLGIFIVIRSGCYPWSIKRIDEKLHAHPGKAILSNITVFLILACTGALIWVQLRKKSAQSSVPRNASIPGDVTPSIASDTKRTDSQLARTSPVEDIGPSLVLTTSEARRSAAR